MLHVTARARVSVAAQDLFNLVREFHGENRGSRGCGTASLPGGLSPSLGFD
jgi:hypothetical protein